MRVRPQRRCEARQDGAGVLQRPGRIGVAVPDHPRHEPDRAEQGEEGDQQVAHGRAAEFDLLKARPGWHDLAAARSGRVFAGNTHLFSRSGPRLVDGVEALARMLHPEAFADRLPVGQALKVSQNGERLEPYR